MTAKQKILLIGSGAREHALGVRLLQSESVDSVVVSPGNGGTRGEVGGKSLRSEAGEPFEVARRLQPDLVIVGPEAPLCAGLADELGREGLPCFGPSRAAARLEGSKAFMKEFCRERGIPTARFVVVESESELDAALGGFAEPPVVKADGLCAGKGVTVSSSFSEAESVASAMLGGRLFGEAGRRVVLEERVGGAEASVHAISDGKRYFILPAAQDHKRVGDGDTGPNTGGMGAYAPAPLVDAGLAARIEREIVAPAIAGMAELGAPFRGALFANVMVSEAGDPVLLEFNARLGDPETQVLTRIVDGDWGLALASAARGELDVACLHPGERHAVCVVLAVAGYPMSPRTGDAVEGLEIAERVPGVAIFHAGTRREGERVVSAGGRVLAVTAAGSSLVEAHERAYRAIEAVTLAGSHFRRDIGARALGG
jgi:phosphoribosylamine--glycine ligase